MSNDSIVKFRPFDNVEATFDTVERIVQLVTFDNVSSTLLLVWTGLQSAKFIVFLLVDICVGYASVAR